MKVISSLIVSVFILLAEVSPFGKMPFLEFDGKILSESKAILSYVSKEHSKC